MRGRSRERAAGIGSAVVLAVACILVGLLCVRAAAVRIYPPSASELLRIAPGNHDVVLGRASIDLVTRRGILDPATLRAVRRAADAAPLDARAFAILGHQQLLDRQPDRAVRTLEAGQHLDPRNPLIHLLLLDRYLRARRYDDAAAQLAVLSRLVGPASTPIAAALAQMVRSPETRDAARRAMRSSADLEQAVLATIARSDTPPGEVLALASPPALRSAGRLDSWGPVLVNRLVERGRYASAQAVWARIYGLPAAQANAPLFDAALRGLAGSPPFNWTLTAGGAGAADIGSGALEIDFYGRESGTLASQLLVLNPGRYRFGFSVEGGEPKAQPALSWSLRCATGAKAEILRIVLTGSGARRRSAANFDVPPGCAAQQLSLLGEAGEFPTPTAVTIRDLDLRAVAGGTR